MSRRAATGIALAALIAGSAASAQELQTFTASRRIGREQDLRVQVTYGAGRFTVGAAPSGTLYRMRLRYDEDVFEPVAEYASGTLHLGVDSRERGRLRLGKEERGELQVDLAQAVPMDLSLDFGAGRANVDLGGLSLTALDVHTGAAEARIDVSRPNPTTMAKAELQVGAADFTVRRLGNLNAKQIEVNAGVGDVHLDLTGEWRQDAQVSVNMGVGSLELRFPEGVGVRLRQKTFLTAVDTEGLVKRGKDYYSLDWDRASRRITVDVQAAFGSVDVRWSSEKR